MKILRELFSPFSGYCSYKRLVDGQPKLDLRLMMYMLLGRNTTKLYKEIFLTLLKDDYLTANGFISYDSSFKTFIDLYKYKYITTECYISYLYDTVSNLPELKKKMQKLILINRIEKL